MAYNSSQEMLDKLYSLLTRNFRDADSQSGMQLQKFLNIIIQGGIYPVYKDTQDLLTLIDYDRIDIKYLPYLASSLGFQFPYDLDEQTQRTYIKNAVISYKTKGTKATLEFMIRELTRFKTTVTTDDVNRDITVTLEVDLDRQDYQNVVDKVTYFVNDYSPPYNTLTLVNTYLWEESKYYIDRGEDDWSTISPPVTDISNDGAWVNDWFISNMSLTNSDSLTGYGELYDINDIVEEIIGFTASILDEDSYTVNANDEALDWSMGLDDGWETDNHSKTEDDVVFIANLPIVDIDYELANWFGTFNNSTTNNTVTFARELYDIANIVEDWLPDTITQV